MVTGVAAGRSDARQMRAQRGHEPISSMQAHDRPHTPPPIDYTYDPVFGAERFPPSGCPPRRASSTRTPLRHILSRRPWPTNVPGNSY